MIATGLTPPGMAAPVPQRQEFSLGGIMSARPLATVLQDDRAAAQARATTANNAPMVQELSALLAKHWSQAKYAKLPIEQEMLRALRAKRGQYDPELLSQLQAQGGSQIYMMLFASKSRAAKALVSDVIIGTGTEKPWTLHPSPKPDLPPEMVAQIAESAFSVVQQAEMSGAPMAQTDVTQLLRDAKEHAENATMEEARTRCARAETKVEDMLVEGDYMEALDAFIDDLTVFKSAFIKGPVVRKRGTLEWQQSVDGTSEPVATYSSKPYWERVDPLMIYPAAWNKTVHDGFLFERHRLSRSAIQEMIGVEGYSEDAIRQVLDEYGRGGLHEWLMVDTQRSRIESERTYVHQDDLIDALQYWGSVSGKMLREWGVKDKELDDAVEYEVECWKIGQWVIKAVVNNDPLARRPYFKLSYEEIPGAFWGNSLFDCVHDCCDMCNGAARALANNLGIASGPQVWVNVDRIPKEEDITQMYPWKLWQTISDPMGSTTPPIGFFQPNSNAQELMMVYERYSTLADEYSGIPRYMTGSEAPGGAGRTASGMSMMVTNAGKTIKKMVASIDIKVLAPMIDSAFMFAMRYVGDPDIKGDLNIVARGAMALITKETAQVRRNEFLMATANPIDMQIIGVEGRAALLRENAKALDMNSDNVVPSVTDMRMKQAQALMMQQAQVAAQKGAEAPAQGQPSGNGQALMDNSPVTDHFSPQPQ